MNAFPWIMKYIVVTTSTVVPLEQSIKSFCSLIFAFPQKEVVRYVCTSSLVLIRNSPFLFFRSRHCPWSNAAIHSTCCASSHLTSWTDLGPYSGARWGPVGPDCARWCPVVSGGARWCVVLGGAWCWVAPSAGCRWCEVVWSVVGAGCGAWRCLPPGGGVPDCVGWCEVVWVISTGVTKRYQPTSRVRFQVIQ